MLARLAVKHLLKLGEGSAEFVFVSTDKFVALLTVQEEVELGDGRHIECHRDVSILVSFDGTEGDLFILVSASIGLKDGLKAHARWATRRPEVNNHATVLLDNR